MRKLREHWCLLQTSRVTLSSVVVPSIETRLLLMGTAALYKWHSTQHRDKAPFYIRLFTWQTLPSDVTNSSMWRDKLICVTWQTHLCAVTKPCDVTNLYVWQVSVLCAPCHVTNASIHVRHTHRIHEGALHSSHMTRLIYMCDMTRLIYTCDMTYLYTRRVRWHPH